VISGFRRDVDEICALPGYFPFLLGLLTREDGTDTLSRNVGLQLPHDACNIPEERRSQREVISDVKQSNEFNTAPF
jgi:hypothetical protein